MYRKEKSYFERLSRAYDDLMEENRVVKMENRKLRDKNLEFSTLINNLGAQIEEIQIKNDLLMRYYSLDREATEDEKTAMRVSVEIFNLKMENWQLRRLLAEENRRLVERSGLGKI